MGFDIILVQEHWLLSNNVKRIKNGVVNFTGIANSGMDDIQCLLSGRPYGGRAILLNKKLCNRIGPVHIKSLSKCICNIMLTLHTNEKLLIIFTNHSTNPGTMIYNKC